MHKTITSYKVRAVNYDRPITSPSDKRADKRSKANGKLKASRQTFNNFNVDLYLTKWNY